MNRYLSKLILNILNYWCPIRFIMLIKKIREIFNNFFLFCNKGPNYYILVLLNQVYLRITSKLYIFHIMLEYNQPISSS